MSRLNLLNFPVFIQANQFVIPTQQHDYPEWHRGREHYALWYLSIEHPALVQYLEQLKQQFSDLLLTPNTRQFHITLYICGFSAEKKHWDDDFVEHQFQRQLQALQHLQLQPFQLQIGGINSFNSALFVDVQDHAQQLCRIRQALSTAGAEIAALQYHPHITLGLYQAEHSTNHILERIQNTAVQHFDLNIRHLNFGYYQAKTLQGPLFSSYQFPLGAS
ncbi:2'-5' RNA ligase family protein [Acinetobacter towneri]|jgi:2'-5' RNA ligase|nr:2'-5' RNA ligase family protein [Acinetobacter towneri]MDM1487654.1 2'-5' RNA ligase family protein [Acinetobacter towneri]MEB6566163.1 2'-5' RNA ligase family protein [Acinetobacter towneri]